MRVLLTGHGGFVGSHTLIHLLHNTDWEVVGIDSFRHKGVTDRVREMLHESHHEYLPRFQSFTHDLTVPFSPVLIHDIGHIDYIISMASDSHVDRSITDPGRCIRNNVNLAINLLDYAMEVNPQKFLHVSTDEVYGPAAFVHKHKEGEPHRPSNPYSASKSAQESICYAYWRTYDLPIVVTNTMNIFGEMQDPEKFAPMVIKKILHDEKVTIHASAKGKPGSRFYLHARNQADALLYIIKALDVPVYSSGKDMAHYHVVGEREVDNLEMAQLIAAAIGKELQYELVDFHSSRPGHDLRYALDGTKLAAAGWKHPVPFEASLVKMVKWTVANPKWLKL